NYCYLQPTYQSELDGIQRRIDFARSMFLVSSWFVLFVIIGLVSTCVYVLVRTWRGTSSEALRLVFMGRMRRLIAIGLGATLIATMGWLGYAQAENNFNERAFGYWLTNHVVGQPPLRADNFGPGALLWMQTSPEYSMICEEVYDCARRQLPKERHANAAIIMDL